MAQGGEYIDFLCYVLARVLARREGNLQNEKMNSLDVQGFQCPLPILKTRRAMSSMENGERLEVLATDPGVPRDMQHYCAVSGNKLLQEEVRGEVFYFLLEKSSP